MSIIHSLAAAVLLLQSPVVIEGYSFHPSSHSRRSLASAVRTPASSLQRIQATQSSSNIIYRTNNNPHHQLSMHMGHSHSHNLHQKEEKAPIPPPKTMGGHVLKFSRRPVVRLVFAFAVVCIPALIRRRHLGLAHALQRSDLGAFFMISAVLTFADGARREGLRILDRVRDWKDGFLKHQAPPRPRGKSSLTDRLFSKSREEAADRVTLLGVITNLILSVGKFIVGMTCHSSALIADAGHSLSDLFSDFITLWAVQIARLPPDEDHPYGHGKFEAVGALFLALTLLGTGLSVGAVSNGKLLEIIRLQKSGVSMATVVQIPKFPALIMAFLSIVSKEWLYRITRTVGEDLNSQVVLANAWHHRSDAYSSILALISIALAMTVPGMQAADSAAGLLVGGMICLTGAEIMGEAVKQLTDASADDGLVQTVKNLAFQESADVLEVTNIRTRQMGSKAFVDVYITTSESLSTSANRAVEERVKYAILKNEPNIVDADVHARPATVSIASASAVNGVDYEAATMEDDEGHSHSSHSHDRVSEGSKGGGAPTSFDGMESQFAEDSASMRIGREEVHRSEIASEAEAAPHVMSQHEVDWADETVGEFSAGDRSAMLAISSFQEVEDDARQLLDDHASIRSIEGCTVHYDEALQEVQVDVTVKLENPDWTTVTIASSLARELKIILEEGSANIAKANIFLDLNASPDDQPPVMTSAPASSGNSTVVPMP